MRRRAPPSSLRLVQGPTPPRNAPRHKLPSMPSRTFHPTPDAKQIAVTRSRSRSFVLPSLEITGGAGKAEAEARPPAAVTPKLRGPWDHSGSIAVSFNVENVLAPLEPVAYM